jgi:NDP-sugar pyrophosphorylase family protein
MKAVILAGGKGRRLEPYTTLLPKPLMPVGDMPVLEIILKQLKRAGFTEAILAVGHLAGLIEAYFGDGESLGIHLRYSVEHEPLGTVGPLKAMEPDLRDGSFLVMNGDVLTDLDLRELFEFHKKEKGSVTVCVNERKVGIDFGVVKREGKEIVGYEEKPTLSYWVSMGIYVFHPDALRFVPESRPFDLPDLVLSLLENRKKVSAYPYDGFWLDIGREEDFRAAQSEFERMRGSLDL